MSGKNINRVGQYKIRFLLPGLVFILISGCNFFTQSAQPTIRPQTETIRPATITATSTRIVLTATRVSPSPSATSSPSVTLTSIPTQIPTQVLPGVRYPETPVPVQCQSTYPAGQLKILLLGADLRGDSTYRTDSILLLTLNQQQESASLLSIPPALYVNIPDIGMERINSASSFGGAGKVMDTFEYNLGVRPDKFLSIDLNNFTRIIEFLDTIDVYVTIPLTDRCDLPRRLTVGAHP
jgi:LCP family protein required for cell wall assembly